MRSISLAMLLVLFACDDHGKDDAACAYRGTPYAIGDVFPAGDGCNSCMCTASGASCTTLGCVDGGVDANPASCVAFGGCPKGPACGVRCCGSGERCVNGTCQCGSEAACSGGDFCTPVQPGGINGCGVLCCGVTGPCPG